MENIGAFLLGQQPAHRAHFAHFDVVAIESGEHAVQAHAIATV
jgi:hypothetical protein